MSDVGLYSGSQDSSVAICTLSSAELFAKLVGSPIGPHAALIGPLETENIGIDRMAATLLERPRIRWLIVCGQERRGPYQAQALRSLFAHGIEDDGKIIGARSRRARLRNLTVDQVAALREQVTLRDLSGVEDLASIAAAVEQCRAEKRGPFERRVAAPLPEPIRVPHTPFRLKEHDPLGFFVILADAPSGTIFVEHYLPDGSLGHRVVGPDAESLCGALIEWGLLSRLDHAAYLGRELAKAEIALREGRTYRQDDPLP
ncbi:MAG TPA: DUF4346 domain-containing protein [Chloroflexota bacterium]|nr:DUF4346 domain-containing protein [Chloroflexota bacterium]